MKETLLSHWNGLGEREQRMAMVLGMVLILFTIYYALINPLVSRANDAQQTLNNEQKLASWVGDKVSQIKALQGQGGAKPTFGNMPLNQAVTTTVARFSLQILRLQPQNDDLQVSLAPMPFNDLLRWLDELEKRYVIQVKFLELDKSDTTGIVEVKRLQLGRE